MHIRTALVVLARPRYFVCYVSVFCGASLSSACVATLDIESEL